MPRVRFCSACGWEQESQDGPGLEKCPICQRPTQDRLTRWDSLRDDLTRIMATVLAFGVLYGVGTWLFYPYSPGGENAHLNVLLSLNGTQVRETPRGAVVTFSLDNPSSYTLSELELDVTFFGQPTPTGGPETLGHFARKLVNIAPQRQSLFEMEIPRDGEAAARAPLFGWTATITTFRLPPGYWNGRLEKALYVRLQGQRRQGEAIPVPFDPH